MTFKRLLYLLLKIVLLSFLFWNLLFYFFQEYIIFPGHYSEKPTDLASPISLEKSFERIWIKTENGDSVEAWFMPSLRSNFPDKPNPAVIFLHGNGRSIDYWPGRLHQYRHWGFSVLLPEYRGYGRSQGNPGQIGIINDMIKFRQWLVSRSDIDPQKIVYHGFSIGGGVACQLAARVEPAALILQSTFINASRMTIRHLAFPFLLRHPFANDQVLSNLNTPVLIMHGTNDLTIPVSHSRQLHNLAKNSTYYEEETAGHHLSIDSRYWKRIRNFLSLHLEDKK